MYFLLKNDWWGNKIPFMAVSHPKTADRLLKDEKNLVTDVIEIPKDVQTIMKM